MSRSGRSFFFSSRRRHTRWNCDWSSDVCSSDLDYVLTANRDETAADLDGWVTLTNNSGTGFQNAQLQLVAGELNRAVPPQRAFKELEAMRDQVAAAAPAPFQQEAFSEYHLYTLGRRTSVLNNESKQVSLLDASSIPLRKTYEVNGQQYYYRSAQRPGAPLKDPVQMRSEERRVGKEWRARGGTENVE